jgi:hypothetical protein
MTKDFKTLDRLPMRARKKTGDWLATTLSGGDRRSIGRVAEVVVRVAEEPWLVSDLVEMLQHPETIVRIRAADALEKLQHLIPSQMAPFQTELLNIAQEVKEPEIRWHMAQMLPRIPTSYLRRAKIARLLKSYCFDASIIVRVSAMQGLADLAKADNTFRLIALRQVNSALEFGAAAEKARARKLLPQLESKS